MKDLAQNSYDDGRVFENQEIEIQEKLEKNLLANLKKRIFTGKKPNKLQLPPLNRPNRVIPTESTSDKDKIIDHVETENKSETMEEVIPKTADLDALKKEMTTEH